MSLPRYPKYKDSGVEWLGEVPVHWEVKPIKGACKLFGRIGYRGYTTADIVGEGEGAITLSPSNMADGVVFVEQCTYISWTKYEESPEIMIQPGDLVMVKTGSTFGKVAHVIKVDHPTTINPQLVLFKNISCAPRFLFFVLNTSVIVALIEVNNSGSTIPTMSQEAIGRFRFGMPPMPEQNAIAAFLDKETGKIDELVAEQQRLMELLKEKRQAVISHAVTKGLNPDSPMKPSGIEWLGDVPDHWDLTATKRLFRLIIEPAPDDNSHELLSIYTDIGVRPRKSLEAKGNKATTTDGYWMVQKGDLIVNKLLAWMGAIGISDYDGVTSPAYDILRQRIPLDPRFYDFLFRCGICFSEFRRHSRGIMDMRLRLYFNDFGQLVMPFPPEPEQRDIVAFLQGELARFDELTAEAQRAIDLLQERRTALISAAVTGQIDVRQLSKVEAA